MQKVLCMGNEIKSICLAIYGLLLICGIVACDQQPKLASSSTGLMPQRSYDEAQLALGMQVFTENCALCHGESAQGAKNWHQRNADGSFPAPPLNGTGHAWHHSLDVLYDVIANGSQPGQGNISAWKDKLSKEQINAVIMWFQSLWPDQVYAAWYETQQRK